MAGDRLVQDIRDTEVQKSKKDIELRKTWNERIEEYYKQAKKILEDVEKTWDKKLYWKFVKEYSELYNTIKRSIETEKKISIEERNQIKKEYIEIINLQSQKSLEIWTKKIFHKGKSTLDEAWKWIQESFEQVKQYAYSLEEKWIWDFISNEWLTLQVLKIQWINTREIEQKIKSERYTDKIKLEITYIFKEHKIWDRWLNQLQEKLIDKILWAWSFEKGFGKWYIIWYNNEKWNYIQTIESFESELKNQDMKDINSLALANYIIYKTQIQIQDTELIKILWKNNLKQLWDIWKKEGKEYTIAKNRLRNKGKGKQIDTIMHIASIFENPHSFINEVGNLNKSERELVSIILKMNYNNIIKHLEEKIDQEVNQIKGKTLEEKETIKNEIESKMNNLIKNNVNLEEVLLTIKSINKDYGIELNEKKTAQQVKAGQEDITQEKVVKNYNEHEKAKKNWDTKKMKELEEERSKLSKQILQNEKDQAIISKLTDKDIKEVSGKWSLEKIIEEKRKEDEKFDTQLKKYEEQEKVLNLKYEKSTEQKPQTILKESYYTDETTGATFTRTWANWYIFIWSTWENWNNISIPINTEEALQFVWKKEAQENLVHFYNTLSELRLTQIWSYRNDIFTAIGNKLWGMAFKTQDNDYLNNNEVAFFLKYIAYSVKDSKTFEKNNQKKSLCKNIIDHENDLKKIENDIKTINNAWTLKTWESEVGKSILEQAFYDKFLTVDWKAWSAESNVNNLFAKFTEAIS